MVDFFKTFFNIGLVIITFIPAIDRRLTAILAFVAISRLDYLDYLYLRPSMISGKCNRSLLSVTYFTQHGAAEKPYLCQPRQRLSAFIHIQVLTELITRVPFLIKLFCIKIFTYTPIFYYNPMISAQRYCGTFRPSARAKAGIRKYFLN